VRTDRQEHAVEPTAGVFSGPNPHLHRMQTTLL
jgi:hypothetical protein